MNIELNTFEEVQARPFAGKRVSTNNYDNIKDHLPRQRKFIYSSIVAHHAGIEFTSLDVCRWTGLPANIVSPRLTDLEKRDGLIVRSGECRRGLFRRFRVARPDEMTEFKGKNL